MYYQNGNYMQDLNYYNQNPNMAYNPYITNNYQMQNRNMNPGVQMPQQQNLSAMYPAVYRIIAPVASQVLANSNTGFITEDSLNSMVDSVYNIVEGDINLANHSNATSTASTENANANNTNCARTGTTNPSSTTASTATSRANEQNALLRDLIKIMLLNEIISRRQNANQQMMMQNSMQNGNMFV